MGSFPKKFDMNFKRVLPQVTEFFGWCTNSFSKSIFISGTFVNLSKALETVDHPILIKHKLLWH